MEQILGYHELKGQAYRKITEATFSFPKFKQKTNLFRLFIPEIHSILESRYQIDHTHFLPFPLK